MVEIKSIHQVKMTRAMKYTGVRAEQYEELKSVKQYIDKATYDKRVNTLNKKQEEANKAYDIRAAAERKRIADMIAEAAAIKSSKNDTKILASVSIRFICKKTKGKEFPVRRTDTIFTTRKQLKQALSDWETEQRNILIEASQIGVVSAPKGGATVLSVVPVVSKAAPKNVILMKSATALDLDNHEIQTWDTGNGTCVYDFLIWRYGQKNGCKKVCTYEALDSIFGDNAREDGVSILMLEPLCDAIKVRMYALDEENTIIHSYKPKNINKDLPPLIFRIKNAHFYAIMDKSTSISQMGKRKSDMDYQTKEIKEAKERDEVYEIKVLQDEDASPIQRMIEIMKSDKTEVYPFKNIQFDTFGLRSFILKNTKYIFDEEETITTAQRIAEINDTQYNGESTFSILLKALDDLKYTEKSICNPHVQASITAQGVKWRTHYGSTPAAAGLSRDDLNNMVERGDAVCADISKCYTACIEEPYDEFITVQFNDVWTPVTSHIECMESVGCDGELKTGLYFVETNDMTLLHGSNKYSNKILDLASAEGIHYTITHKLIPEKILPRNHFEKLLNYIDTLCKGDKQLKKSLTNIITGFLGKQQTTKFTLKLNTDVESVWNDFSKSEYQSNDLIMHHVDNFYLYGYKEYKQTAETNIPMYIQILDWSNMRLYNMIKKTGGVCLYRKTDCAIISECKQALEFGTKNGDYRQSDVPQSIKEMVSADMRCITSDLVSINDWNTHSHITNSNQVDEIYDILMNHKGLINVSRAGTGKTYNCLEVEKRFMEQNKDAKVFKIAFTNKAAMEMKGTTIHKFLKIDQKGKFNLTWLTKMKNSKILIIIDELSMIGEYLWRRLAELKKALPLAYFMLLGDYRQAQPVEENPINYFDSSVVKYMSNYQKIELTVRQRYDEDLWDFAERVYEDDVTDYEKIKCVSRIVPAHLEKTTNICFYNSTRKHINKVVNNFVAATQTVKFNLPYTVKEDQPADKQKQQDALLYVGCPVIAFKNFSSKSKGEHTIHCVNNEAFTIKLINAESIVAVSKRAGEDGEPEEHTFTISTDEFHEFFLLNYCSTTHKQQGATIDNDIIIFDYEDMPRELKYTAVTRPKKLSQISIYK
jgi:hypothetical protein